MQAKTPVRQCQLTDELQALEIRWIHHPSFELPNSVHELLESSEVEDVDDFVSVRTHFGLNVPQIDLLSAEDERQLFTLMNCLRYLAAKRKSRALSENPRPIDVRTVRNLLESADAVRDRIANANQRLMLKIASGFRSNPCDTQDLIGEAAIVLLKAINGFDVSRGFRFSTYATHAIQRHLSRVWKRHVNRRFVTNGEGFQAIEVDDEQPWVDAELASLLPTLLNELNERERRLIQMRFGLGSDGTAWTYSAMAHEVGLSSERVRQIVIRACKELRKKYSSSVGLDA